MRNMSFALTKDQILDRTKTVTRRLGWAFLKPGDLIRPVEKCMGLKKGEKVRKFGDPIRIVSVNRESLWNITCSDVRKEGFTDLTPYRFVIMFGQHMKCGYRTEVTRIEFEYVTSNPDRKE